MKKQTLLICVLLLLAACANQPLSEEAAVAKDYSHILTADGRSWDMTFEYTGNSSFSGVVRHVSRWHDSSLPFMTHDVLVTSGDFALPNVVSTSVIDHKFFYHYTDAAPSGTINLLHIFPASSDIFEQLEQIRKWDQVTISGREILKIDLFNAQGQSLGYFTDLGCNSILVTSVDIQE